MYNRLTPKTLKSRLQNISEKCAYIFRRTNEYRSSQLLQLLKIAELNFRIKQKRHF